MELKRLGIRNFLGIGEGEIAFDRSGVVLIEGVNHDSPYSISNGAGKSSIFEALFWGLYGKTKRGLAGDDVVNNVSGKDCRVEVEFDDFLVIRTRKDNEHGTGLFLKQRRTHGDGDSDAGIEDKNGRQGKRGKRRKREHWKDLSLGTARETQRLIEDAVKMSDLTFSKVAYFGQGDIRGFAGLSDSDLKRVFEEALGLTFFAEYRDKVREYRSGIVAELSGVEARRTQAARECVHVREKMEILKRSIEEHYERLQCERLRLTDELDAITRDLKAAEEDTCSRMRETEREIELLASREDERKRMEEQYGRAEEEYRDLDRQLARKQAENAVLASRMRGLEEDICSIEAKQGTPCETCGKIYEARDLEAAGENLSARLAAESLRYEMSVARELGIEERLRRARDAAGERKERLAALDHVRLRMIELESRRGELKRAGEARSRELLGRKTEAERRLARLSEGEPGAKALFEKARCELARLNELADTLAARSSELSKEAKTAGLLEEALGNGGVKSYVFDAITPQLNRIIDRNIKMLDDIDIEVSTVTRLKSGEYRERFSIGVRNHHGASVFEGNSGGEIQKINLAISLAVNSLVRTISEGSINAIFLDECFENLDEGSSERVLELIGSIDTPNVFIITQRSDVRELIPSVIRVEKRGGRASLH